MIAACPTCGARYRIDTAKLRPEGARLRCSRCESVFRVRAPVRDERSAAAPGPVERPPAPPEAQAAPAPQPSVSRPPSAPYPQPAPPQAESYDRERLVLVAHSETESGKAVADALGSWGLQVILVHDGVEAILNIQRALPRVVVLDAALPKMFGFQVCELMKRNESLRSIHVILVGAIHDQGRYRRPPGELYGADEYVERQALPDALAPLLERFGMGRAAPAADPASMPEPTPSPAALAPTAPTPTPTAEPPAPVPEVPTSEPASAPSAPEPAVGVGDPALAAEAQQAERLARIIVSDIVLYNPERFEEGLRSGDVVAALSAELAEGRALFSQRVDPRVGPPEEFLERELRRVAASRGAS